MNCLEFHRRLTIEPQGRDAELALHRRDCPQCAAFAAEQEQFERRLAQALAIAVPPELAPRLILRQALRRSRRRRYAAAAGVLLMLAWAARLLWLAEIPLEQAVVAHIHEEPEHLLANTASPDEDVAGLVRALGGRLEGGLDRVRYAGICRIGRHPGGHLVLAGAIAPVTVLILPHEPVAARRVFASGALHGVIAPAGGGSLAIVGAADEPLDELVARLQAVIRWPRAG